VFNSYGYNYKPEAILEERIIACPPPNYHLPKRLKPDKIQTNPPQIIPQNINKKPSENKIRYSIDTSQKKMSSFHTTPITPKTEDQLKRGEITKNAYIVDLENDF